MYAPATIEWLGGPDDGSIVAVPGHVVGMRHITIAESLSMPEMVAEMADSPDHSTVPYIEYDVPLEYRRGRWVARYDRRHRRSRGR